MRRFYTFSLGIWLFLTLACDQGPKEVLLDSFEGPISATTVDYGSSEGSSITVSAETEVKLCGQQSLKVAYDLKPSGYMWVARGYDLDVAGAGLWEIKPQELNWKRYKAISVSMYGHNSGGVIAFDIKDKGKEIWRFLLDDDFQGWKEIICPLKEFFPRKDWQPEVAEKDDILDFPIKSFQFEPRLPGQGTYYFDCIKVTKVKK